jgi:hypothetical protein
VAQCMPVVRLMCSLQRTECDTTALRMIDREACTHVCLATSLLGRHARQNSVHCCSSLLMITVTAVTRIAKQHE